MRSATPCSERNVRAVVRPKANRILSIILLLPEPLGPDTAVNPFSKGMVILFAKDLKLSISISLMYIKTRESSTSIRQYLRVLCQIYNKNSYLLTI